MFGGCVEAFEDVAKEEGNRIGAIPDNGEGGDKDKEGRDYLRSGRGSRLPSIATSPTSVFSSFTGASSSPFPSPR